MYLSDRRIFISSLDGSKYPLLLIVTTIKNCTNLLLNNVDNCGVCIRIVLRYTVSTATCKFITNVDV